MGLLTANISNEVNRLAQAQGRDYFLRGAVSLLQQTKRDLEDAIITADNSLVHNLTHDDLELLLS